MGHPEQTALGMTDSKRKRPRDTNQLAKFIVDVATGEVEDIDGNASAKKHRSG